MMAWQCHRQMQKQCVCSVLLNTAGRIFSLFYLSRRKIKARASTVTTEDNPTMLDCFVFSSTCSSCQEIKGQLLRKPILHLQSSQGIMTRKFCTASMAMVLNYHASPSGWMGRLVDSVFRLTKYL